jgi:hypothetical protein
VILLVDASGISSASSWAASAVLDWVIIPDAAI